MAHRVKGSIGKCHLWPCSCFSSSVPHVLFISFGCFTVVSRMWYKLQEIQIFLRFFFFNLEVLHINDWCCLNFHGKKINFCILIELLKKIVLIWIWWCPLLVYSYCKFSELINISLMSCFLTKRTSANLNKIFYSIM